MTYPEAIEFLYGLQQFGARPGLESIQKLATLAGNPQDRLQFIHVAGTNGKGSTCAMLESIYRANGLRVGLFTSPHLVSFSERIQVNRQTIPEADVARRVEALQPLLATFTPETHPTFFEVVTVMALQHFAEQHCELVILETGLGGRLDATNIVQPLASVITNVQFDHERWLGHTLAAIATEKAGIIKPGIPTITSAAGSEVLAVIQDTARQKQSSLTLVTSAEAQHAMSAGIELPLLGGHQRLNAALTLATVRGLQRTIPVSEQAIRAGLAQVQWPGRMQLVNLPGGRRLLLDGAHNPDGAATLRAALAEYFPDLRPTLILGVLEDKDWRGMCELLAPIAGRLIVVGVASKRALSTETLAAACREANAACLVQVCANVAEALNQAAREPLVVIAGSLYLIGEAMESLHLAASPASDEKPLNEWVNTR